MGTLTHHAWAALNPFYVGVLYAPTCCECAAKSKLVLKCLKKCSKGAICIAFGLETANRNMYISLSSLHYGCASANAEERATLAHRAVCVISVPQPLAPDTEVKVRHPDTGSRFEITWDCNTECLLSRPSKAWFSVRVLCVAM